MSAELASFIAFLLSIDNFPSEGVTISHNGTEVFVGSGFTVEERIRYAADPNLIIGKQITVQCEWPQ